MSKFTTYKLKLKKGYYYGNGEWMTKKDWEDHYKWVEELKANGEYGKEVEYTFNMMDCNGFNNAKPVDLSDMKLLIPRGDGWKGGKE